MKQHQKNQEILFKNIKTCSTSEGELDIKKCSILEGERFAIAEIND